MDEIAQRFVARLSRLEEGELSDDSFLDALYEAVDSLGGTDTAGEVVPSIFQLFENRPDAGFGMPGPLVHLLEGSFSGEYEESLLESLARKPVAHTLWPANRLLNSTDSAYPLRERLLNALLVAITQRLADDLTRQEAQHFLERFES